MRKKCDNFRLSALLALGFLLLALSACGQYRTPITEQATRRIDLMLIGDWVSPDRKIKIKIRELNETTYVVTYNSILFKAFHSDVSGVAFVSVQELETPERSFTYLAYRTSDQGAKLYLRLVNKEVIADDVREPAAVRSLLTKNLHNPALFLKEAVFTRERSSQLSTTD